MSIIPLTFYNFISDFFVCLANNTSHTPETEVPMQEMSSDVAAEDQHSVVVTEILHSTGTFLYF
jgi:hypothetical protein